MDKIIRVHFRRVASMFLFVCLFLPLSECTRDEIKESINPEPDGSYRLENANIQMQNGMFQFEYIQLFPDGRIQHRPIQLPPDAEISDINDSELYTMFYEAKTIVYYPITKFTISKPFSWLYIPAFFWPCVIWIIGLKYPNKKLEIALGFLSFLLCFLTGFILYVETRLNVPRIGWYISSISLAMYFISLLYIFGFWCYTRYIEPRTTKEP